MNYPWLYRDFVMTLPWLCYCLDRALPRRCRALIPRYRQLLFTLYLLNAFCYSSELLYFLSLLHWSPIKCTYDTPGILTFSSTDEMFLPNSYKWIDFAKRSP